MCSCRKKCAARSSTSVRKYKNKSCCKYIKGALLGNIPSDFAESTFNDFEIVREYVFEKELRHVGDNDYNIYKNIRERILDLEYKSPFDERITQLPDGVLPKDGILYHGTRKPRTILREGFSTTKSNQSVPREFGAGVYLTPDRKIASFFAGITGRIMHVRADVKNTALVNTAQFKSLARETGLLLQELGYKSDTAEGKAVAELLTGRLFNRAGYDSVYTTNGMSYGLFAKSSDTWLGRAQSQLVVFDGAKVSSTGKKILVQKIKDELAQICTNVKVSYNLSKMCIKDPVGMMMQGL